MSIISDERTKREKDYECNCVRKYENEILGFMKVITTYFIEHSEVDKKIFSLPNCSEDYFTALNVICRRSEYDIFIKRVWWSKKKVKVYLYNPFQVYP